MECIFVDGQAINCSCSCLNNKESCDISFTIALGHIEQSSQVAEIAEVAKTLPRTKV